MTMHRLDEARVASCVPESSRISWIPVASRIRDSGFLPHGREKLVLGDDATGLACKQREDGKRPGCQPDLPVAAFEALHGVQFGIGPSESSSGRPRPVLKKPHDFPETSPAARTILVPRWSLTTGTSGMQRRSSGEEQTSLPGGDGRLDVMTTVGVNVLPALAVEPPLPIVGSRSQVGRPSPTTSI